MQEHRGRALREQVLGGVGREKVRDLTKGATSDRRVQAAQKFKDFPEHFSGVLPLFIRPIAITQYSVLAFLVSSDGSKRRLRSAFFSADHRHVQLDCVRAHMLARRRTSGRREPRRISHVEGALSGGRIQTS